MRNEELKLLLDAQFTAVRATIKSETDGIHEKVNGITERLDRLNGSVSRHEQSIHDLEIKDVSFQAYQENCPANKIAKRVSGYKFWLLLGAAVVVASLVSSWLYHNVDLIATIENRTGIDIIDEH